jgi:hypothetical protein
MLPARLSADSSRRVRRALTEAVLRDTVQRESEERLVGVAPALPRPWDLFLEEGCTWRAGRGLDNQLLQHLRGLFDDTVVREILLAAAGVKISRTCLSDAKLELLRPAAEQHAFEVVASSKRYIHRRDSGKGGSSNSIERVAGPTEEGGLRNVYIAADANLAKAGQMLEEAGDDENFGLLLGIPQCCREAFVRWIPIASAKQNDFVLPALDNTSGEMPYNFWLNYPANYFGPGLIGFFPCSFQCANAAAVARSTFEMLSDCNEEWAQFFLEHRKTNILYTEYEGLHLFRRPLVDGCIEYGPDDHSSTESSRVSELISRGSRLEVRGKHSVVVYRQSERIASIEGADVGMCAFH